MSRPRGTSLVPMESSDPGSYTVVARRYRPQRFEDVVGQDHVVQALRNAIRLNRVTHAYLFSGTRGVGKTSIARIFAKCLNCIKGPTEDPDQTCDICQSIAVGQDVDVIEIDGASNNGVEQVRELRQNAGLRPSRARFKIYYIDEVHMLSTGAFNALLKTLEEPPEHVKFFFATTEPNKIPITVLSRCQRYDFAGINPDQIVATLGEICDREAIKADPEALAVLARRAGGSMRDAQSLLEQLLSFGGERLTVELVQQQLGIASDDRTLDLLETLSKRDPAGALKVVDTTTMAGVQPTELLAGATDFLRDAMVIASGAEIPLLAASPRQRPRLQAIADRWKLPTLLSALQIFDETRRRLRGNSHGRTMVEIALVKVSMLEDLGDLGEVVNRLVALEGGAPVGPVEKKKLTAAEPPALPQARPQPVVAEPPPANANAARPVHPPALVLGSIAENWAEWVETLPAELSSRLGQLRPAAIPAPNVLVIEPIEGYNWVVDACERPELRVKIEAALRQWLDHPLEIRLVRLEIVEARIAPSPVSMTSIFEDLGDDPLIKLIVERFEAKGVRADREDDQVTPEG